MNMPNRHTPRHGRMLLVLLFVFTSIVPGSLHAFAMAEAQGVSGGGHHAMMGHVSGDQSVSAHHMSQDISADFARESIPTSSDIILDRCCPATCFVALCTFDVVSVDRFVPESFEIGSMPKFIVVVLALPERPPRA